jgi:capsular exopolysaccharide synthesis family protein
LENLTGTASILWRGKHFVVAGLVAGVVVAVAITKLSAKVYGSTAIVQVESQASAGTDALGLQQASQSLATTYATLLGSRSFLARIRPQVEHGRYSTDDLASRVGASAISQSSQNTNLIEVSARESSPATARSLASAVASAFVSTVEADAATSAAQQQAQLQQQIARVTKQIDAWLARKQTSTVAERVASLRAARSALTTQLAAAIADGAARQGSVAIVGPPTESDAAVSPRPLLNVVVGAALGLLLGIAAAWLRSLLDRQLHGSEEVPELVELPVLASVALWRGSSSDDLVTQEGYEVLRTNLTFVEPGKAMTVLLVTSYQSGEGKTATVDGLARAAARHGARALVVDGDLRTRALSRRAGCLDEPGLVNIVLTGRDDPGEAAVRECVRELEPGLFLLPAGPPPPNPPSLLANPRMSTLLWQLRFHFDLIVVDAPPVAQLADAAILAGMADASVVIARAEKTKKAELVAAVEALRRTPTPVAGAVVFERRTLDATYYPAGGALGAVDPATIRRLAPLGESRERSR